MGAPFPLPMPDPVPLDSYTTSQLNAVTSPSAPPGTVPSTDQFEFLRAALNTASLPEIYNMIRDEIASYNMMKIELKRGDHVVVLDEEPRHYLFKDILDAVDVGIHVALIGPAGSGKSTVVEQIAKALGKKYYLQNSVSGTHEVAGYMDAYGKYQSTPFRSAFERGGVILIDEVDTSDPGSLKWLNTALANKHAVFPDKEDPVLQHPDFRMVIAANTFGSGADRIYVGANQLDASTLDRFVFFDFGYDEKMETVLSGNPDWAKRVQTLRKAADKERARVVISPRATITGAKLLKMEWSQDTVEERLIWKGMDPDLKNRILETARTIKLHEEGSNDMSPFKSMGFGQKKKRR